ncbi:MAG: type II toxin-antitoxin system death-on-curing family toxin [Defluviicoccus sp.]|nr:type II toxin-antitoxin system death-on-curing family toxin [Defluviicoccus sp.]MDE2914572.1 type II toxin-antitoxin system death-on-curing family toxin [Paracoccaceae bacterium]
MTWQDAIRGHEYALRNGGAPGILNESAIESALARPYHGYHRLIHQKAAALVHAVVSNHGFADGNKRTALHLVELLVQRSGYVLTERDEVIVEMLVDVARGDIDYDDLAKWFRVRLVRNA